MKARLVHMRRARWIGYPRAQQVLDQLEAMLSYPKTHRMPCLLIAGDTNAGKTMIANRFVQAMWHRDIDRGTDDALLVLVAAQTGTHRIRALTTTFRGYKGYVAVDLRRMKRPPWLLRADLH